MTTRVAVIGTSWWAEGAHLPGLRGRPDVEVAALCGRDPARLARVADRFGIAGRDDGAKQLFVVPFNNHHGMPDGLCTSRTSFLRVYILYCTFGTVVITSMLNSLSNLSCTISM